MGLAKFGLPFGLDLCRKPGCKLTEVWIERVRLSLGLSTPPEIAHTKPKKPTSFTPPNPFDPLNLNRHVSDPMGRPFWVDFPILFQP